MAAPLSIARGRGGAAIDERVAQIEAGGAVTYMHTDRQSSVIAISDAAGNVTQRRGYGTYGGEAEQGEVRGTSTPPNDPAHMTGSSAGSTAPPALRAFYGSKRSPGPFRLLRKPPPKPFGYTGRRWDGDLGLYYYRARWYDPQLGTFLQTDPIGSLDYVNLYAYVGLEPGNATDPSGMQSAEGLFHGLNMAKAEAGGGARVETQVREQAVRDIPVYVAAGAVTGCALGGCAVVAEAATLRTTVHGAARIAGAAATRGGVLSRFEVAVTRTFGQRMVQADGASVSVLKTAGGRFNVVVRNNETGRVVTTLKGISQKSFDRLARRYGYQ